MMRPLLFGFLGVSVLGACSQDELSPSAPDCRPLGETLQAQTAPPRRGDMAFGYDTQCNRVFMFHGDNAEPVQCGPAASRFLDDAYTFDVASGTWAAIDVQGTNRPLTRARAVGAWDSTRHRFLLFGGRFRDGTAGPYTYLNDLWAFDPQTRAWTELWPQTGGPGEPCGTGMNGRMNAVATYDPNGDRFIVMGGGCISNDFQTFPVSNDIWAFDLQTNQWRNLWNDPARGAPGRLFHAGALDTTRNRLYVFGGGQEDAFFAFDLRDMWYFDLDRLTWIREPRAATCTDDAECAPQTCFVGPDRRAGGGQLGLCNTPRARIKHVMAYDDIHDQIVLFAGHDNAALGNDNDLWTFNPDSRAWTLRNLGDVFNAPAIGFCDFPTDFATVDPSTPERRESHLFVVAGGQAILYGGRSDCGLVNDTWTLDLSDYTWTEVNRSFSGMTCYRAGRTDCEQANARKCG